MFTGAHNFASGSDYCWKILSSEENSKQEKIYSKYSTIVKLLGIFLAVVI